MVPMLVLRSRLFVSVFCLTLIIAGNSWLRGETELPAETVTESIEYNRDVRPILADHCFACHGPDSASRKADLRLDDAKAAEEMGAVVPNDLEGSELVRRIRLPDTDDLAMPPNTGHKRLSAQQRTILERWIEQGAVYQPHWSFIAPQRPELPSVTNEAWVRNPIDRFILATLEANGLQPAPEADRRTLTRRLSLDLTGLPPDPKLVESVVLDSSPQWYENLVDQLLESDRWGEHRGRHWLDYARYADTHGIHFDNYREMWSYRDWVIQAFNRNMPFDQFTIEQLAGDLLPDATLDQQIASGFNRCNITTNEGGIIDEEYKVLYARDRTETTSAVWMSLTTGCAVCHDHKFDPINKKDFYSLSAFFNNTTQPVRDGNVANNPPIVVVPLADERDRYQELVPLIAQAQQAVDQAKGEAKKEFGADPQRIVAAEVLAGLPRDGLITQTLLSEGAGNAVGVMLNGQLQVRTDNSPLAWAAGHIAPHSLLVTEQSNVQLQNVEVPFEFDRPFTYSAWIYLTKDNITGAVLAKMDVNSDYRGFDLYLEGGRVGGHLIHKWQDNAIKVMTQNPLPKERWHQVTLTYDGKAQAKGLNIYVNGELRTDRQVTADKLSATIQSEVPLRIGARSVGTQASGTRVNDVRFYDRQLTDAEVQRLAINSRVGYLAQLPRASLQPTEQDDLFNYWLANFAPRYNELLAAHRNLQNEEKAIRERGTVAHIMQERKEEAEAFILERGEYDQRRDRVTAETPHSLPPMASELPKNRLGLAKWLVAPEHPLMSRVTVNRFWQEVFGTGLVATSGDFGISGQLPSHPQLLDWLAIEFREKGWDVKQLIRSFVCSATYRQSAQASEQKLTLDPANRLLSRGPRFRMDAEMIRDYALACSGLLSDKIGGPSVKPYQPDGVWEAVAMTPSNTRFYKRDSGEALYRRSMYTFWKRSAPPASMDIFNAPSREVCTVRRERTNTPLQALASLNDPQLVEAARHLATKAMEATSETDLRIDFMTTRLLARTVEPAEREIIDQSLKALLAHYQLQPEAAKELLNVGESPIADKLDTSELAAYTMLANELMNLDEVVTK